MNSTTMNIDAVFKNAKFRNMPGNLVWPPIIVIIICFTIAAENQL